MILKLEVVILTLVANVNPLTLVAVPIVLSIGWMDASSTCTVTMAIEVCKIIPGFTVEKL
jgi:hypothetical protein